MFDVEFKEGPGVLVLGTLALGVALVGTNPLKPADTLNPWVRVGFAVLGVGLFFAPRLMSKKNAAMPTPVSPSAGEEYEKRFEDTQRNLASIIPESKLLAECQIGKTMVHVVSGDIVDSKADVVVSSDDNHFTARGGVAKAILTKGGMEVHRELESFRKHSFRQGHLGITTGGKSEWRAILHPAVIDLDESRYPSPEMIRVIVERCLFCAEAIGAQRIAFPILGGGTGSRHMTAGQSADAMMETIIASLKQRAQPDGFSYIALYSFKPGDADPAVDRLNRTCAEAAKAAQGKPV